MVGGRPGQAGVKEEGRVVAGMGEWDGGSGADITSGPTNNINMDLYDKLPTSIFGSTNQVHLIMRLIGA